MKNSSFILFFGSLINFIINGYLFYNKSIDHIDFVFSIAFLIVCIPFLKNQDKELISLFDISLFRRKIQKITYYIFLTVSVFYLLLLMDVSGHHNENEEINFLFIRFFYLFFLTINIFISFWEFSKIQKAKYNNEFKISF